MIVTISGTPGSGKSTLARNLAEKLGYAHYSIGDLRRKLAKQHGMTIAAFNKLAEEEEWADREPDEYLENLGEKEDNFVIDARLGWYFVPKSIKILVICDIEEGAKRVLGREKGKDDVHTLDDAILHVKTRQESDKKRYQKWYKQNPFDKKHYEFVLDTTDLQQKESLEKVYEFVKTKIK